MRKIGKNGGGRERGRQRREIEEYGGGREKGRQRREKEGSIQNRQLKNVHHNSTPTTALNSVLE